MAKFMSINATFSITNDKDSILKKKIYNMKRILKCLYQVYIYFILMVKKRFSRKKELGDIEHMYSHTMKHCVPN